MKKKTVILLHTPDSGIGKSTLAKHLIDIKVVDTCLSFAVDIKYLSLMVHNYVSNIPISFDEFSQTKKDENILNGKSPRDLTCLVSDLVQEVYGNNVWAERLYTSLNQTFHSTFIVDDWRRYIESDYLSSKEDLNIIKVYLTIEGLKPKDKSKVSSSYEFNIKPEDCDLHLTYKQDYSNFKDIVNVITNKLKS